MNRVECSTLSVEEYLYPPNTVEPVFRRGLTRIRTAKGRPATTFSGTSIFGSCVSALLSAWSEAVSLE